MSSSAAQEDRFAGRLLAGRYRLLHSLGRGGMGQVYLAEHCGLGHRVAVKILHHDAALPNAPQRFLQEARETARLRHPNIVDVVDLGQTDDGAPFLVMEYLEGEDLGACLQREGRLPWYRARTILIQICRGLQAAHDAGLVHRDLKPENCWLCTSSEAGDFVKLLDFGIAKSLRRTPGERLTSTGGILGTPEYMSPEQARGRGVDPRSDVYAVGILAYEMLTGRVPFTGDDTMGILMQHLNDPVPPMNGTIPGVWVDPRTEQIVLQTLQKDPALRPSSAAALAEALLHETPASADTEVALLPQEVDPIERPRSSRRFIPWVVLGGFAAAGGAAIATVPHDAPDRFAAARARPEYQAPAPIIEDEQGREPAPTHEMEAAVGATAIEQAPTEGQVPAPDAPTPSETASSAVARSRDRGPSRRQIRSAMSKIRPLTAACIGGLTGGKRGDRIRVQLEVAGDDGRVQRAVALGPHVGTLLGRCVADAAAKARFGTFERRRVKVVHVFEL